MEERFEPEVRPSELEAKLGRRREVVRPMTEPYSGSKRPGPTDFRGGFVMFVLETGG